MFTQPQYNLFVNWQNGGHIMEFIYFGDYVPSASPGYTQHLALHLL